MKWHTLVFIISKLITLQEKGARIKKLKNCKKKPLNDLLNAKLHWTHRVHPSWIGFIFHLGMVELYYQLQTLIDDNANSNEGGVTGQFITLVSKLL